MQDGPEVCLICHLSRTYGRVTEAHQGDSPTSPKEIFKKPIGAKKDDQGIKADPARAG